MKDQKKKRRILLLIGLLLCAGLGAGIWFFAGDSGESVNVYPFHYLGMTEYWGDSRESYGPVTTDKIQTVFLSDTQTVTEIAVQPGDTVKKGDLLLSFDTTLDDLALERKRLDVEKIKLQRQAAQERLTEIQNMVPMVLPEATEPDGNTPEQDLGIAIKGDHQTEASLQNNGAAAESPMICWLREDTAVTDTLLEELRQLSAKYRSGGMRTISAASAVSEEVIEEVIEEVVEEEIFEEVFEEIIEELPEEPDPPETEPPETEPPVTEPPATDPPATEPPATEPTATEPPATDPPETDLPEPTLPEVDETVEHYFVVFKITAGNMSLGARQVWQGVQVFGDSDSGFALKFFNADAVSDPMLVTPDTDWEDTDTEIVPDSGYTAAQIAELRSAQEKLLRDLAIQIDMAEAEYKIMQTELGDGHVYAAIDGEVVSVLTEEEARDTRHPIVKLSGGGGFYIEGSISELEMKDLTMGQEVTVNDWNTGMTYTGEIIEVRDFPSNRDNWNGTGNPNVSYYPFRVFVSGDADLQEGSHVSVMYSTGSAEQGIYLENAFIRTEQGRSYVYLRGSDGRLEKRYITVGKSLWGSYSEVLSNLTEDDLLAFPYGKEVKEGAKTKEADISELYAY